MNDNIKSDSKDIWEISESNPAYTKRNTATYFPHPRKIKNLVVEGDLDS